MNRQQSPPPSISSTDEILDVFEHIRKAETTWLQHFADHGLKPEAVQRALQAEFEAGDGRLKAAISAFAFGLAFGAMRLEPIAYNPEEEKPCDCSFCQFRRMLEGATGLGESDED